MSYAATRSTPTAKPNANSGTMIQAASRRRSTYRQTSQFKGTTASSKPGSP